MFSEYQEEIFDKGQHWINVYSDSRFKQRYCLLDDGIYCETRAIIGATPDTVIRELRGSWDWWKHGRYTNRIELSNGTITYDFYPVTHGIHVFETMHEPVALNDTDSRIRIDLQGSAVGLAYFDVRASGTQETILIGRFAGVQIRGFLPRLLGKKGFAVRHLGAERGQPGFPFRTGTGWLGLIQKLEDTSRRRDTGHAE